MSNEIEIIKFSTNWNNKLNCGCFTTIRHKSTKYQMWNDYRIMLENDVIGEELEDGKTYMDFGLAKIVNITPFFLKDLTDGVAYVDSGYSANELKKYLVDMEGSKYKPDGMCLFMVLQYNGEKLPIEQMAHDRSFNFIKP